MAKISTHASQCDELIAKAISTVSRDSGFDHDHLQTLISTDVPRSIAMHAADYLFHITSLKRRGRAVALIDANSIVRNVKHSLFITDEEYGSLRDWQRDRILDVVGAMVLYLQKNLPDPATGSLSPSNMVLGYTVSDGEGTSYWAETIDEANTIWSAQSDCGSIKTWEIGTTFSDRYTNFAPDAQDSGYGHTLKTCSSYLRQILGLNQDEIVPALLDAQQWNEIECRVTDK